MGPRTSISGELPIHSYFGSSSKTAGTPGNKEDRSLKRRTEADATNDAKLSSTKKQRTKRPSEGAGLDSQNKLRSEAVKPRPGAKAAPNAFVTTSLPTPTSLAKPPRSTSSRVPADREVITITSLSPQRETPFDACGTGRSARNTASGSGLQTPQTVCHEDKKDPRTDAAARLPTGPMALCSARKSGPVVSSSLLPPPKTPSRSKAKRDHVALACRTTPQSQRIVPSSQWSDYDQPRSETASSLEANRDPFTLRHREESDSCLGALALPPSPDVSLRPSSTLSLTPAKHRAPPLRTVIGSSKGYSPKTNLHACNSADPADRGQGSQIVPTSQFDEVELKVPSQSLLFIRPTLPPQIHHRDMASSVGWSQAGSSSLQDQSSHSHSEAIVEQQPPSKDNKLPEPPSPLTPLSHSSQLSAVMDREMDIVGADSSPPQRTLHKTPDSEGPAPCSSPESVADLGSGGMAQPLPEEHIPAEDPRSDEDEDFLVHPSPVRRRPLPANVKDTSSPAGNGPSASARTHLRISHAKLRSLPGPTVGLDSDGEEISSDGGFSIPGTSQDISMSSSYLDLVGTLPSAVEDFLDMINAEDAFFND